MPRQAKKRVPAKMLVKDGAHEFWVAVKLEPYPFLPNDVLPRTHNGKDVWIATSIGKRKFYWLVYGTKAQLRNKRHAGTGHFPSKSQAIEWYAKGGR